MGESWQKHCGYRSYGVATLGVEQLAMFTKAGMQTRTSQEAFFKGRKVR